MKSDFHYRYNPDKRFKAPARRRKVIKAIARALNWRARGNDTFFLFRDRSRITTDQTGRIYSTGGKATKAYFKFQVWNAVKPKTNLESGNATQP
jgi:hypothetical protein